ncbi:hypothetical protein PIB30_056036 [Stylosanthes scabra]|uniref:Ribonuclease H1 N-terminal domain-containing protein n=1 Tax=Stylosanthes scabra TaxID=79078 RepID=A0ABU6WJ92_9FABA|nr:hypothetical protein [Stylosanthes scabra]
MATSAQKFTHYAVRIGRNPGIYTDWDEAEEQEGQSRKMKGAQTSKVEWLTPQMQKMGVGSSQATFTPGEGSGSSPTQSRGSQDGAFVPETQLGGFIIAKEMDLYLVRICTKLGLGTPKFEPKAFHTHYGARMFTFSAELRCEEKGIMLAVDGCAYTLLDKLLTVTGHAIMDFNYK